MSGATDVTSTATADGFSKSAFERFLNGRDEPGWLVDRRRKAFELFQTLALPTSREEEWRRTDIRGFKLNSFSPPAASVATSEEAAAITPLWDSLSKHYATGLAQANGCLARSADPARLGGAILADLTTASRDHPDILKKYLFQEDITAKPDYFSALHAAFWTGGTFLYVPKGVHLEEPLFSLLGMTPGGNVDLEHTLVVLEDESSATLIREASSVGRLGIPALHAGAVELFLNRGSRLRFVNIQNWDAATWHFSRERAFVGKDAKLQWTVGGLGSRLAKVNQEVALTGEGARAQVNGVMFTTGKQHLAYFTRQDHQAPNTFSDLLYKAGLKDHSRIVWKGMIRVEKDAQKTDAYQKNENLILSDSARADSIPGLEIEANDVRCTHGATAGRVDEEMIFYAQARGVSRETAIRLIVEGFFANVYDRISVEQVRETLRAAVSEKLELNPESLESRATG